MHKLLLILLMASSCFAAQFPSDDTLKLYIYPAYLESTKDGIQKNNILKNLTAAQLMSLIRKIDFKPTKYDYLYEHDYVLELSERARQMKLVSHEIDCDELANYSGDSSITSEQIKEAKERLIERDRDETTADWILRIKSILDAEKNKNILDTEKQWKSHLLTGLKVAGALAFTAVSITLVARWYKKRNTEKQNAKQPLAEEQQ